MVALRKVNGSAPGRIPSREDAGRGTGLPVLVYVPKASRAPWAVLFASNILYFGLH